MRSDGRVVVEENGKHVADVEAFVDPEDVFDGEGEAVLGIILLVDAVGDCERAVATGEGNVAACEAP